VGVVMLMVVTAKAKRIASERQKAIELSQLLIEDKVNYFKDENNILSFWNSANGLNNTTESNNTRSGFLGYSYDVKYLDCNSNSCKIVFVIKWGNAQSLSVERVFLRKGL
jgi:hypothetical protein